MPPDSGGPQDPSYVRTLARVQGCGQGVGKDTA
jgi:hypothetical protein